MYNPNDQTVYIVDDTTMADFYSQLGWLAISHDTPKNKISNLAFDKPSAFSNKTPWTGSFNRGSLQYQPNHVYANPTPTEFQTYFKEERAKGRTPEQIYRDNSFMVKTIAYTPPAPQPTPDFRVAAVIPALPSTYTWNVSFRSGLTQAQKDSITNMLTNRTNTNQTLNETDARNYAYAIGNTNWVQFVGKRPAEVLKKEVMQTVVETVKAVASLQPVAEKQTIPVVKTDSMTVTTPRLVTTIDSGTEYLANSIEQLWKGNYTNKVTLLGTAAQVGTGLVGIDIMGDIRDLTHDVKNWEWNWGHAGKTGLDGIGLLPVVGVLKYGDEAGVLLKSIGKSADDLVKVAVDMDQQLKHIPGNRYILGRSKLLVDPNELLEKVGKGEPVNSFPKGTPGYRERIDAGKIIGEYINLAGESFPTTKVMVHYSKNGVHFVPIRP